MNDVLEITLFYTKKKKGKVCQNQPPLLAQSHSLLQHEEEYFHKDHFHLEDFWHLRDQGFPVNQDMTMINIHQQTLTIHWL